MPRVVGTLDGCTTPRHLASCVSFPLGTIPCFFRELHGSRVVFLHPPTFVPALRIRRQHRLHRHPPFPRGVGPFGAPDPLSSTPSRASPAKRSSSAEILRRGEGPGKILRRGEGTRSREEHRDGGRFRWEGRGQRTATLVGWGVHLVSPYVAENERHPSSKDGSDQVQPGWERRRRGDGKGGPSAWIEGVRKGKGKRVPFWKVRQTRRVGLSILRVKGDAMAKKQTRRAWAWTIPPCILHNHGILPRNHTRPHELMEDSMLCHQVEDVHVDHCTT